MNILGIIPARGGSKGIPRKNIIPLAGKPLLYYTCQAALGCQELDRTIINTDDPEIANVGRQFGIDTPFLRPGYLAGDEVTIHPVIMDTLEWLEKSEGYHADVVVLLQPTSPLRTSFHIDTALRMILNSKADTLVSVQRVSHNFSPPSLMLIDDQGHLHPFEEGKMVLRRQEKPTFYARNGPAILIVRRNVLDSGSLYGKTILPFKMSRLESIDIDDMDDLILAELLFNYQKSRK